MHAKVRNRQSIVSFILEITTNEYEYTNIYKNVLCKRVMHNT